MWVKFGKVPECFRHFFGMCEIAASLGHVLEIDMDTITLEQIRAKVGVRDIDQIPSYTEITAKDLMIYRVTNRAGTMSSKDSLWRMPVREMLLMGVI